MPHSPVIPEHAAIELALIGVTGHCVCDIHCC
ncbi:MULTISPECIES: Ms4533A family Cys-rich leader peptide [unclassified Streptomyces]|uniref:Ms4533A family Cys-rich leader peptide n=2 Tax=Streptomyces TaxID=1883 RepID=A0ABU2RPP9_9ACTN|nr:Ms4533A family Cys-rich leader peptide [Streptomyces sp. DSM 41770]MDT0430626.1 Ms4533A family Cys-rich leader peptide [Streptomyces sp. DSM 41770]